MSNIQEQLNDLYKLHLDSKNLTHGIRERNASWQVYLPTKFIYSYFTFNTIYSVNWAESLEQNKVLMWSEDKGETFKIRNLSNFVLKNMKENPLSTIVALTHSYSQHIYKFTKRVGKNRTRFED